MAKNKDYRLRGGLYQNIPAVFPNLPTPTADLCFEEVFDFPFLVDETTVDYLKNHGRVMFIVRGPSGTRKHTLVSIVLSKYPSSELCCADDYFSEPFSPGTKSRDNIKKSHGYCEEKAHMACQEGKHPIVIKNTNMRKWEMQRYIDLATEYCYTVIMVITLRKMRVTSEVLEKTNTQGLKKPYFIKRLKQWEEVVPQYTGWMLSPIDASYLMKEYEKCLESLSELDDFSEVFCSQETASAKDFFRPKKFPFCLATYCQNGADSSQKYYLSSGVQTVYGKVFPLIIQAFVVTKSLTAAVVHLSENMKTLVVETEDQIPSDDLSDAVGLLNVHDTIKVQKPLSDYVTNNPKTFTFCSRPENENIDTNKCSFILLSTATGDSPKYPYIENVSKFSKALFSKVKDPDGNVPISSFCILENGSKYCQLSHDSWLILPPKGITIQSVFTGFYT